MAAPAAGRVPRRNSTFDVDFVGHLGRQCNSCRAVVWPDAARAPGKVGGSTRSAPMGRTLDRHGPDIRRIAFVFSGYGLADHAGMASSPTCTRPTRRTRSQTPLPSGLTTTDRCGMKCWPWCRPMPGASSMSVRGGCPGRATAGTGRDWVLASSRPRGRRTRADAAHSGLLDAPIQSIVSVILTHGIPEALR